jgi:hypothetical protein
VQGLAPFAQILPHLPVTAFARRRITKSRGIEMERIVQGFLRFVAGRDGDKPSDIQVNRIAMGQSHDRALAAFKADQARIAGKREGATSFATKRNPAKGRV